MNQTHFESPDWYKATTLTERIASLPALQSKCLNINTDHEFARRLIDRWQSQSPFTNKRRFFERLAIDGITSDEFFHLLGEPIESLQNRFSEPPDWLAELAQACNRCDYSEIPLFDKLQGEEVAKFLDAIKPLIDRGRDRLHQGIQALIQTHPNLPFDPSTVENLLFANLPSKLLWILYRTIILELNVARLQRLLRGNTPQERFQSFLQRLRQPEVLLSLLQEYPVLARLLMTSINRWVNSSLEFIEHLCNDWEIICATFSPDVSPDLLVQIDSGIGDTHRGGREVLIARFGNGFQVVYKPRSLAVDLHFQQLLSWLNQRGNHPSFRTLKILNQGTHGWVEFVAAHGCNDPKAIQHFYERQGGYLALLYAIEATDFHFENLIAAGEHPILVDLETLFQPRIKGNDISSSEQLAIKTIADSVLRVDLLPGRIWANDEIEGIDISGLWGKPGQLTPDAFPSLEAIGSDEMRVVRERMSMSKGQNRPTLNDAEVNVLDYTEAIISGFTNIYQLLLQQRDELLSENSPLACFAEDEVRFILRPTYTYVRLIAESFHPNLLRNALERDRFFDKLWVGIKQQTHLATAIPAERHDLWQGDIPLFTARPNSRDMWSSSQEKIADFFDEAGMARVRRRLQNLDEADLKRQLWFIRTSLSTLSMIDEEAPWSSYHLTEPQTTASRRQLLASAQKVGDRLEWLALRGEDDVAWIGSTIIGSLEPLKADLYDGLPGVTLFLAYLGAVSEENRYTSLAQAALKTLQCKVEESKSSIKSIGGFDGWGGVIYTLTNLGVLWDEPALLVEAEILVELLPELIAKDEQLDIIGGAAGCLISLLGLYYYRASQSTLNAAIQCGDHLISHAQTMEQGLGWLSKNMGAKPLTGFSHGAAGIAWALLELSSLTSEKRFKTAALAAIEYERSLFCAEMGNWPDLRDFTDTVLADNDKQLISKTTAWCHGATGIGLARLRCLRHIDDADIQTEIYTALDTTLRHGFGSNHSLCHGDLGNLELFLQASQTLDDPQWKMQVDRLSAIILESIDQHGWLCGVPMGIETPGLMTGLAGIGYQLLRLAEPERVPSVLVLEPPKLGGKVR